MAWTNTGGGSHNGADWIITANTTIAGEHTNIGVFAVSTGITATVDAGTALKVVCQEAVLDGTLNGTAAGKAGGTAGTAGSYSPGPDQGGVGGTGTGTGAGQWGTGSGHGGAGGACCNLPTGNCGGEGGQNEVGGSTAVDGGGTNVGAPTKGVVEGNALTEAVIMGAGGSGGCGGSRGNSWISGSASAGGAGARGGGSVWIEAVRGVKVVGTVTANGGAGATGGMGQYGSSWIDDCEIVGGGGGGSGAGGGGPAGGTILFKAPRVITDGAVTATGGAGGAGGQGTEKSMGKDDTETYGRGGQGGGGGGGGGGGRIKIFSAPDQCAGATPTAAGGVGGAAGAAGNVGAGGAYNGTASGYTSVAGSAGTYKNSETSRALLTAAKEVDLTNDWVAPNGDTLGVHTYGETGANTQHQFYGPSAGATLTVGELYEFAVIVKKEAAQTTGWFAMQTLDFLGTAHGTYFNIGAAGAPALGSTVGTVDSRGYIAQGDKYRVFVRWVQTSASAMYASFVSAQADANVGPFVGCGATAFTFESITVRKLGTAFVTFDGRKLANGGGEVGVFTRRMRPNFFQPKELFAVPKSISDDTFSYASASDAVTFKESADTAIYHSFLKVPTSTMIVGHLYELEIVVKRIGTRWGFRLIIYDNVGGANYVGSYFGLATPAVGSTETGGGLVLASKSMKDLGGGFYACAIRWLCTVSSSNFKGQFASAEADADLIFDGSNTNEFTIQRFNLRDLTDSDKHRAPTEMLLVGGVNYGKQLSSWTLTYLTAGALTISEDTTLTTYHYAYLEFFTGGANLRSAALYRVHTVVKAENGGVVPYLWFGIYAAIGGAQLSIQNFNAATGAWGTLSTNIARKSVKNLSGGYYEIEIDFNNIPTAYTLVLCTASGDNQGQHDGTGGLVFTFPAGIQLIDLNAP